MMRAQPRTAGVAILPKLVAVLLALSLVVHYAQAATHQVKRQAEDDKVVDMQPRYQEGRESLSTFIKETMQQENLDEEQEDEEEEQEHASNRSEEFKKSIKALTASDNASHPNATSATDSDTSGEVAANKTGTFGSAGNQTIGIEAKANQSLVDQGPASKSAGTVTTDTVAINDTVPDATNDTAAPSQGSNEKATRDNNTLTEPPVEKSRPMEHDVKEKEDKTDDQKEVDAWEEHMLACFKDMSTADKNKDDFLSPHEVSML
jgi:hypothetical protein